MKIRGINYDVGVRPGSGRLLSTSKMSDELEIIKSHLHCNAVRIYGRDREKLTVCSEIALQKGLMVWLSPRCINATTDETLEYIDHTSKAAETLRRKYGNLIYVLGNEFSLDIKGFLKGDTTSERISDLSSILNILKNSFGFGFQKKLNLFLEKAVRIARNNFNGEITYASGQWEKINWDLFNITSVNYYRNMFNSWKYKLTIRQFVKNNKKFAVTEFGCCSYKGADKRGAGGYSIIDWNKTKPLLKKLYKRDESVQANYINDLLSIYLKENVYAAFIYTFAARKSKYNTNPLYDLDRANFGVIKVLPSLPGDPETTYIWEKKEAFNKISKFYSGLSN